MTCEYCDIIAGKGKALVLYEDDEAVIAIKDTSLSPGQLTVFPKEHFPIMELVPENLLDKCIVLANKASITIFEGINSKGTNIVIQNGTAAGQQRPHFAIEVIPRQEEDSIDFQWPQKQLTEDELGYLFTQLNGEEEPKEESAKEETKEISGDNNELLKSLNRIP